MDDRKLIGKRILDADRAAYERNLLKVYGFLSLDEQSIYHSLERELRTPADRRFLWGGYEGAERTAAFFLSDYTDRETALKEYICALKAAPVNARFADELTHRDYLGALMSLGIERACIGDILVGKEYAVLFVLREMSELISRELTRVKHTVIDCSVMDEAVRLPVPEYEELTVNIASERIDAVLAAVYRVSRQKAQDVIAAERVFINGCTVISAGRNLCSGDRVTVRGSGRFLYGGISGSSRKGRLFAVIRRYKQS